MNKGFSLIEIIVYIGLLSLLMIGVFYSATGLTFESMKSTPFSEDNYKLLIKNLHE